MENRNSTKYFDQYPNQNNEISGSENHKYPHTSYPIMCYDMLMSDT